MDVRGVRRERESRMSPAVHILTWLACDRRGTDKGNTTHQRVAVSLSDPLGQELDQLSLSGVSDIRTA